MAAEPEYIVKLRERAKISKAAAVKLFCIDCMGGDRHEVSVCVSTTCALHCHRPYQK